MSWHNLRQQQERPAGKPHYCLSDFVAERGTPDWIGAFAVGAGFGIEASSPNSPPRTTTTTRSC
jgi:5-methyltetrahydrofolate--homocysteine methyltransferase